MDLLALDGSHLPRFKSPIKFLILSINQVHKYVRDNDHPFCMSSDSQYIMEFVSCLQFCGKC